MVNTVKPRNSNKEKCLFALLTCSNKNKLAGQEINNYCIEKLSFFLGKFPLEPTKQLVIILNSDISFPIDICHAIYLSFLKKSQSRKTFKNVNFAKLNILDNQNCTTKCNFNSYDRYLHCCHLHQ